MTVTYPYTTFDQLSSMIQIFYIFSTETYKIAFAVTPRTPCSIYLLPLCTPHPPPPPLDKLWIRPYILHYYRQSPPLTPLHIITNNSCHHPPYSVSVCNRVGWSVGIVCNECVYITNNPHPPPHTVTQCSPVMIT